MYSQCSSLSLLDLCEIQQLYMLIPFHTMILNLTLIRYGILKQGTNHLAPWVGERGRVRLFPKPYFFKRNEIHNVFHMKNQYFSLKMLNKIPC